MADLWSDVIQCGSTTMLERSGFTAGGSVVNTGTLHQDIKGRGSRWAFVSAHGNLGQYGPSPLSVVPAAATRINFWMCPTTSATAGGISFMASDGSYNLCVHFDAVTSLIHLRLGQYEFSTLITSSVAQQAFGGIPLYVEVELLAREAASGGYCKVWINRSATAAIDYAGDCRAGATNDWVRFAVGGNGARYSDFLIQDAADARVPTEIFTLPLAFTSDLAVQLTPGGVGAGANYTNVTMPAGEAKWNEGAGGLRDRLGTTGFAGVPGYGTPGTIRTVKMVADCAVDGGVSGMKLLINTTDSQSPTIIPGAAGAKAVIQYGWNTNPDTAAAWDPAEVVAGGVLMVA